MGKLYSLLLCGLLWANSAIAQGTVLFTWNGQSNTFQANFQVYYPEIMPGSNFSSQLFLTSMVATNPLGQTYLAKDGNSDGNGSFLPWNLAYYMPDFQRDTLLVFTGGGQFPGIPFRTAGDIREIGPSGATLWYEQGYWTAVQIPEPSSVAVLIAGGLIFLLRRKIHY
jgi:hypothetical protein